MSSRYLSPLRYPGGKATLAPWFTAILAAHPSTKVWAEPFAGGAGAALALLNSGTVERIRLNDRNPAIAALWRAVVEDGDAFARAVERTGPTMALYERSVEVLRTGDGDLAFAAFIVNRCSRSGIIHPRAGAIGGTAQTGRWTVSSRFNAAGLADRIRHIHTLRSQIEVSEGCGIAMIEQAEASDEMLFVDPPYLREGNRLYANGFSPDDHSRLAAALNRSRSRWLLTYDDEPAVSETLYPQRRVLRYAIRNTAGNVRTAQELAVVSDNLDPAM